MQLVFNWHITEKCNYSCHYCFSEWKYSPEIWKNEAETMRLISEISTFGHDNILFDTSKPIRLNFAGGEPLIIGNLLLRYLEKAKTVGLETSIITNGSLLRKNIEIVDTLDMLGISIDSLDNEENLRIGRNCGTVMLSYKELQEIVSCARNRNPSLKLKFNTVVNQYNWKSDVLEKLHGLNPYKIKVFRQLPYREQQGIRECEFLYFVEKNCKHSTNVVVENNADMINSYLMIDPAGRFFQNGNSKNYYYSKPIPLVGINTAFKQIIFKEDVFKNRYKGIEL